MSINNALSLFCSDYFLLLRILFRKVTLLFVVIVNLLVSDSNLLLTCQDSPFLSVGVPVEAYEGFGGTSLRLSANRKRGRGVIYSRQ